MQKRQRVGPGPRSLEVEPANIFLFPGKPTSDFSLQSLQRITLYFSKSLRYSALCSVKSNPLPFCELQSTRLLCSWDSPGKNTGVGCHSLLQRIFPTQGSNPGLPDCKQILYCLSHQGSPSILEWVAYPFTTGSSQPRNWTCVACIWNGFFTIWAVFAYLHFLGDSVVKNLPAKAGGPAGDVSSIPG